VKKIAVVYKSKYGSTKRYAGWIAGESGADIIPYSKAKISDLKNYDIIVFGGYMHAVGISGIKFIKKHLEELHGRKIIVFSCGASPINEKTANDIKKKNFTDKELEKIKLFCLRGAFNFQKLDLIDKVLMGFLKRKLESIKESERDEETKELLQAYVKPSDFTNKEAIEPILSEIAK